MTEPVLSFLVTPEAIRIPADRGGGRRSLHIALEVRAADRPVVEGKRAPIATVLAVDISGSMQGPPLEHVVRSVDKIVEALAPDDQLGLVAFAARASRIVPVAPLDSAQKRLVRSRAARLVANGGTNVEDGLRTGSSLLAGPRNDLRRGLVLLSDGAANVGLSGAGPLRDLARELRKVGSVSTLGYGTEHDEAILGAIADGGGGVYRFIADPLLARMQISQAIGSQVDIVAENVEIIITPERGVRLDGFVGEQASQFSDEGIVVPLADFVARGRRIVVARVEGAFCDPTRAGRILRARLRWKVPGKKEYEETTALATVDVGGTDLVYGADARAKVALALADRDRAAARGQADRGQFDGAAATLRNALEIVARLLAEPGASLEAEIREALEETRELLLDEAMAMERRPSAEQYSAFKKQTQGVSMRACRSAPVEGGSRALGCATAGDVPEAYLVHASGGQVGERVRLTTSCSLGRTGSADIVIASESVSRRHAEIFALEGEFWICDLGSTNATNVNGVPLGSAPRRLQHRDSVKLGGIELLFECP